VVQIDLMWVDLNCQLSSTTQMNQLRSDEIRSNQIKSDQIRWINSSTQMNELLLSCTSWKIILISPLKSSIFYYTSVIRIFSKHFPTNPTNVRPASDGQNPLMQLQNPLVLGYWTGLSLYLCMCGKFLFHIAGIASLRKNIDLKTEWLELQCLSFSGHMKMKTHR